MKIPDLLTQALQTIFQEGEMHEKRKGEETPDFYLSENFLEQSELISYCDHKFLNSITPHNDNASDIHGLNEFIHELGFKLATNKIAGCFFYPSNGFMGWHTNYSDKDWRIYIVNSLKGDSFFRYKKDDKIITEYDPVGWSYRAFYVGDASNPYWHCVNGGSGRYSIGFRLKKIKDTLK
jgi:hypothetical protein